jgi:hypothetical protein
LVLAAAFGEAIHAAPAALLDGDRGDREFLWRAVAGDCEQPSVELADDCDL